MLPTPGWCWLGSRIAHVLTRLHTHLSHWFRKKWFFAHLLFQFVHFFSEDFYFHLSLIERKIMHTFISFRFQSHTFQERKKIRFFFASLHRIFYDFRRHLCASEIFIGFFFRYSARSAFKTCAFLPHSLRRKEMSIFGYCMLFGNLHRISIYLISNEISNKSVHWSSSPIQRQTIFLRMNMNGFF